MDENSVVSTPTEESGVDGQVAPQGQAMDLITVSEAIKARLKMLDEINEKMRQQKEMVDSFLAGDQKYQELLKAAKKANQDKNLVKNQLLKTPHIANNVENLKSLKENKKEMQEGLSYFLQEFQRLTGANQFEGLDGEVQDIVYIARLVRRSQFKK